MWKKFSDAHKNKKYIFLEIYVFIYQKINKVCADNQTPTGTRVITVRWFVLEVP